MKQVINGCERSCKEVRIELERYLTVYKQNFTSFFCFLEIVM